VPLHPVIQYSSAVPLWSDEQELQLHVDGVPLLVPHDISQAVVCMFAAHWIFNVQYAKKVTNFWSFFELHVFGLQEAQPRPAVMKLIKMLS